MNALAAPATLLARILISAIFVGSVLNDIPKFDTLVGMMEDEGVPAASFLLVAAIAFKLAGGLSVIAGFQARLGAALLLIFLIPATYYFHDFWTFQDAQEAAAQQIHFMKNLGLMGATLFILANGPGPWSLDAKQRRT